VSSTDAPWICAPIVRVSQPFPIYGYPTLISTDQCQVQNTERDQREGEIFPEEFLGLGFTKPWEEEEP
jgi:hypothetical protein